MSLKYSALRKSMCTYKRCWIRLSWTIVSKKLNLTIKHFTGIALQPLCRCALIKGVGSDVHERRYSKNWIKQLHTFPVLHFNRCLTTEYSETTAHFNGNVDTDNQSYVP
jgi:hypothetical protein